MSWGLIGAIVGLGVGIVDFLVLRNVAAKPELTQQSRTIIGLVSYISLVIFPIVGWYAGANLLGVE